MSQLNRRFYAREVEVLSIESFRGGKAHEPMWAFTYGEREDDGDRYCIASLHAATDSSVVTIVLGVALSELVEPVPDVDTADAISGDPVLLQPLFERARSTARAALGIIDKVQDLTEQPDLDLMSDAERKALHEERKRRKAEARLESAKDADEDELRNQQ